MSPADVLEEAIPFEWHDPKRGRLDLLVSPLNYGMEAFIQRTLEDRALKAVQRHREAMTVLDFETNWSGWRQECAAGVYAYAGPVCFRWMFTDEGRVFRAWVMLRERCPDVTPEMVERVRANAAKWKELEAKVEMALDPNRRRPAAPPGPPAPRQEPSPSSTPAPSSPGNPGVTPPTSSAASPAAG
jgi:hypothetical protein